MGRSSGAWATVRRKVLARDRTCRYLCDKLGADQVDHLVAVAEGRKQRAQQSRVVSRFLPRPKAPRPGVGTGAG
jgi:5-methylcytosine-specific restriction endonuclease McrA